MTLTRNSTHEMTYLAPVALSVSASVFVSTSVSRDIDDDDEFLLSPYPRRSWTRLPRLSTHLLESPSPAVAMSSRAAWTALRGAGA